MGKIKNIYYQYINKFFDDYLFYIHIFDNSYSYMFTNFVLYYFL